MRPSYCLEDPFYSPLVCTRGQLVLGELVAHLLLLWASPSVSVVQCIMQAISPVKSIAHFSPGKCIFQCLPSGSWKVRLKKPHAYFFLNKSSMSMQFLGAAKAGLVGASIRTLLLEATSAVQTPPKRRRRAWVLLRPRVRCFPIDNAVWDPSRWCSAEAPPTPSTSL